MVSALLYFMCFPAVFQATGDQNSSYWRPRDQQHKGVFHPGNVTFRRFKGFLMDQHQILYNELNDQEEKIRGPDVGVTKRKQHKSSSSCTQENLQALMFRTLTNLDQRKAEKPAGLGDPDVLFGQQVGLELKQIPNKKRRQELKLKIQGLIFKYQFENEA